MFISKNELVKHFAVVGGRLICQGKDVRRNRDAIPTGYEGANIDAIAWTIINGEPPKGPVRLVVDDILAPYTPENMICSVTGRYADNSPVPQEILDSLEIEHVPIFDDKSSRDKENSRLPTGITKLKNGKFRFKRSTLGIKRDVVSSDYNDILKIAEDYQNELDLVISKIEEGKKKTYLESSSGIDMRNIYKRGQQYFVEFMVNRNRICLTKTRDLNEAIRIRDEYRKDQQRRLASIKQDERLRVIKSYETLLLEGLRDMEYNKLKIAMAFLTEEEFNSVIDAHEEELI